VFANTGAAKDMKLFHDNPEWQQIWEEMGELSAQEIDIKAIPTEFDTQVYKSRIKVDLTTPRAPAIFKWWFGYRAQELIKAGLLADLSDVWEEVGDNFAPGIQEALTQDGMTYGFPLLISYWVWFYNKPLYEKHGLELPKTWDEFMEQLAFFKEQEVSGIGNTIGQSRWTSFIVFQELLYRIDAEFYIQLVNGQAHWTDPKVVQAMELWKDLLDKGYFAPMDATYVDDMPRMFKEGTLAFAPFGDWYGGILQQQGLVSGTDYGIFIPPAITPAGEGAVILEISPLVSGKNSSELELAKEWFKWYASAPSAAKFRWEKLRFAPTTHVSPEEIAKDDPARAHEFELIQAYPKKMIRFWEATPVEIVEHAVDAFNTMLVEPDKYMDILNGIEEKAKETWPNYEVEY
jgi:multiple sugar transport system substrate-binding protein